MNFQLWLSVIIIKYDGLTSKLQVNVFSVLKVHAPILTPSDFAFHSCSVFFLLGGLSFLHSLNASWIGVRSRMRLQSKWVVRRV